VRERRRTEGIQGRRLDVRLLITVRFHEGVQVVKPRYPEVVIEAIAACRTATAKHRSKSSSSGVTRCDSSGRRATIEEISYRDHLDKGTLATGARRKLPAPA
jgi:hypothetical protein